MNHIRRFLVACLLVALLLTFVTLVSAGEPKSKGTSADWKFDLPDKDADGVDWTLDKTNGLFWSNRFDTFFDRVTGNFYHKGRGQWFNMKKDKWSDEQDFEDDEL